MKKPLYTLGKTCTPPPKRNTEKAFDGKLLHAFLEDGAYYLEYDIGHLASKFVKYKITRADFEAVRKNKISERDLINKYKG